jgi:phage tail sheath protein FI
MAEYLSPGVYVEEKSSGIKPIEGVGTSTGAFVGIAERGPVGEERLITNWTKFVNTYGSFTENAYLAYAVYQFFVEGGTRCYVVRTCHYSNIANKDSKTTAFATGTMLDDSGAISLKFTALEEGTWGNDISIEVKEATNSTLQNGFKLVVKLQKSERESFDNLTMEDILNKVNSSYVKVEMGDSKPIAPKKGILVSLEGGNNGGTSISVVDFEGDESAGNGLHAFDVVDDINIVAMPDIAGNRDAIIKGFSYCQNRRDCFFIADSPLGLTPTQVKDFKEAQGIYTGENAFNSSYAALFYPWLYIADPLTGGKKLVPPSGAVAGTFAHTDSVRGVHKAPAGTSEGYLDSVTGIEKIITKGEHDVLNPASINVIRSFPTGGICIWGARTLSADPEWRYINIRRLFLFLEESIDKASQWVVFEPNSPSLWGSVKRNITAFLLRVWRDGALFGSTPEEAFFVKVDEENNPEEVRDAGQLIIEVGVAPVKPAEFVIIRISQKTQSK